MRTILYLFLIAGGLLFACQSDKPTTPQAVKGAIDTLALLEGEWACVDAYWKNIGTGQRVDNDPRLPPLRRDYWIVKGGEGRRYPMNGYENYPMGPSMSRPFRITIDWGRICINYFWGGQWMCGLKDDPYAQIPENRFSTSRHIFMISSITDRQMALRGPLQGYGTDKAEVERGNTLDQLKAAYVSTYVFERHSR